MTGIEDLLREAAGRDVAAAAEAATARAVGRADDLGLVDVAWTREDTPIGPLVLAGSPRGLVMVAYDGGRLDALLADLAARISPRVVQLPARLDPARRQLDEYFAGRRTAFDLPLDFAMAGGFRRAVLDATMTIPYGSAVTYADIARRAGNPRATRAAGNALGANPLCIVVPCHRVRRADGALGGYAGGPERKRRLLTLEGAIPQG